MEGQTVSIKRVTTISTKLVDANGVEYTKVTASQAAADADTVRGFITKKSRKTGEESQVFGFYKPVK